MVAVRSAEAERFISHPPPDVFCYLVFGSDAGLVAERLRAILVRAVDDPADAFQLVRIAGDDLASDPLRLVDEANSVPMFGGGRKAIGIDATGRSLVSAIEPLLRTPPRDCVIAVEGGNLKRDSALRRLFENAKRAAAIDCQPDSAGDLVRLIDAELAAAGLTIEPEAKELLASLLGQDRLTTRAELAKLIIYAHGSKRVTTDDVEAIVSDASDVALDDAVDGAFNGDVVSIETTTERAFGENGDVNQLLSSALRHAIGLHRSKTQAGDSLFGARRAKAQQQARLWTADRLLAVIGALGDAIGHARREPRLAQAIARRALWTVALGAREGNRR